MINIVRPKSLEEFLRGYCLGVEERPGCRVYRGTTGFLGPLCGRDLPPGFEEVKEWGDGQGRRVWKSDAARAVVTYAEGDVDVVVCDSGEAYREALRGMAEFYSKH